MKNIILSLVVFLFILFSLCVSPKTSPSDIKNSSQEIIIVPNNYNTYLEYVELLKSPSIKYKEAIVEATIIDISISDFCPYKEQTCRIEPYPKDSGIIKINKIIQTIESQSDIIEAINRDNSSENKTDEYKGEDITKKEANYAQNIDIGRSLPTIFLLTSRPVSVNYEKIGTTNNTTKSIGNSIDPETTSNKSIEQNMNNTYENLLKKNGHYVFTTKIGDYNNTITKELPGLKTGDIIIAHIYYDGVMTYIEEYELKKEEK